MKSEERKNDEFHNYLLTAIESSDSPLKEKLIEYAKLFYAPHTTTPYEVAHPNNFSFKHPEEAELSQQLYDFVCKAAEATGCRVKSRGEQSKKNYRIDYQLWIQQI